MWIVERVASFCFHCKLLEILCNVDAGAAHGILWATNGRFFGSSGFFTAIKRKIMQFFFPDFHIFVKVLSQVKQGFME